MPRRSRPDGNQPQTGCGHGVTYHTPLPPTLHPTLHPPYTHPTPTLPHLSPTLHPPYTHLHLSPTLHPPYLHPTPTLPPPYPHPTPTLGNPLTISPHISSRRTVWTRSGRLWWGIERTRTLRSHTRWVVRASWCSPASPPPSTQQGSTRARQGVRRMSLATSGC